MKRIPDSTLKRRLHSRIDWREMMAIDRGLFNVCPELNDVWVSLPPCVDDRFELMLGESHSEGSHGFKHASCPLITIAEGRNLPLLPKITVHTMYFDRDAEHPARGFAVEVLTVAERVKGGGFSGESGDDARLDCRKVRDSRY